MVYYTEMTEVAREQDRLVAKSLNFSKIPPKTGELLCGFIDYNGACRLTSSIFIGSRFEASAEKRKLASALANCFALHSQSAQPIEIRRRFSFLLPPLFAPGRCAASLFKAVVMPLRGVATAFALVGAVEPLGV